MHKLLLLAVTCFFFSWNAHAQIPSNSQKHYEYKETLEVKKAGSGDLYKRFEKWANEKYAANSVILLDDTNNRFITIATSMTLPESHFGVNRIHRNRVVEYMMKFDMEKKVYTYQVFEIRYMFEEEDRKGGTTQDSLLLEQFKSPTKKSVEEEVDLAFRKLIEEIKTVAMTDID